MNRLLRVLLLTFTLAFGAGAADVFGQDAPPPTTYYWIGGDGNWNDPTHWSAESGGAQIDLTQYAAPLPPQVPDATKDVVFDANSGNNFTVTISGNPAVARNMNWTGAVNPTLDGIGSLTITGSLALIPTMQIIYTGSVLFATDEANRQLTFAGKELLGPVQFNGNGSWILQDRLGVIKDILIEKGTVNGNNQNIEISGKWVVEAGARYISGTGTVTMKGEDSREIKSNPESPFHNLVIDKPNGNVLLVTPVQVNNNLSIQNGIMRDEGFQINGASAGTGRITIATGASLLLGDDATNNGATTFPAFNNAPDLSNTSTVNYRDRATPQTVVGINYGNLVLSNGPTTVNTLNSKILSATATVRGNLTVGTGINFIDNGFQITGNNNPGRTLSLQGNATLTLGNPNSNATGTTMPDFPIYDFNASININPQIVSTVNYTAGGSQSVKALPVSGNTSVKDNTTYGRIRLSGTGVKTLSGYINVRDSLSIREGAL